MSQLTLQQVLNNYLPSADLKDNSLEVLDYAWQHFIKSVGNPPISEFTGELARKFKADLLDQGYSATTICMWIKAIRPVTRWAWKSGHVNFDAWADIKLPRVGQNEVRVFSSKQCKALLAAAPDARRRLILMLGLTGLRIGETLSLRREDINLTKHQVHIRPHEAGPLEWPWSAKDSDCRIVPLYDQAESTYLCEVLPSLPTKQPYVCLSPRLYLELLVRWRNGKMTGRWLTCPEIGYAKWVERIFARASYENGDGQMIYGIEGTFHNLRDTAATNWLNKGKPIHEVAILLGHSSVQTTEKHYWGPDREKIASEARQNAPFDD